MPRSMECTHAPGWAEGTKEHHSWARWTALMASPWSRVALVSSLAEFGPPAQDCSRLAHSASRMPTFLSEWVPSAPQTCSRSAEVRGAGWHGLITEVCSCLALELVEAILWMRFAQPQVIRAGMRVRQSQQLLTRQESSQAVVLVAHKDKAL
eukprot:scaffold993_cov393-Prasinococcus_capsulatus_cf.AAC.15